MMNVLSHFAIAILKFVEYFVGFCYMIVFKMPQPLFPYVTNLALFKSNLGFVASIVGFFYISVFRVLEHFFRTHRNFFRKIIAN
jgi:hypothetical protein